MEVGSSPVRLRLLGPLEVERAGEAVRIGSPSQRRLLAVLLVHRGEVVTTDRLADIVWSGDPPPSVANTLKNYVYRLRGVIGAEAIVTQAPGYMLQVDSSAVDASAFESLIGKVERSDLRGTLHSLEAALALWRGPAIQEFAHEDWARPTAVRLDELRVGAQERRIELFLELGRFAEAVADSEALAKAFPLREAPVALLMQALAGQGRTADALRTFDAFRKYLSEETGLNPSAALFDIERSVLLQNDKPPAALIQTEQQAQSGKQNRRDLDAMSVEDRLELLVESGDSDAAALVSAHLLRFPKRDRAHALYLRALHRDGRIVEALTHFANYQTTLRLDDDREPSATLRSLARQLEGELAPSEIVGPPSGQVAFLFTDVEGSTELWSKYPKPMHEALRAHDAIVRSTIRAHGGFVFATAGDSFGAAFDDCSQAAAAAIATQRLLTNHAWPSPIDLRVRLGLHFGEAIEQDGNYFGHVVNIAARVEQAAHGGQIVATSAFTDALPEHARHIFRDLGEHRLRGTNSAVRLLQLRFANESGELDEHDYFGPLRTQPVLAGRIPTQSATLIGRDDAIADIRELVATTRILTLLGPGGIGKTSIAIEVLMQEAHQGQPVFFVDLAGTSTSAEVVAACFRGLGVLTEGTPNALDELVIAIEKQRALIVIDNCEHVLDAAAELIEVLLTCPNVRVLATSREALAIAGERAWHVPSLSVNKGASRLFCSRAGDIDPSFVCDDVNDRIVAEICRRLDGLPLAIELAASRVRSLSLHEIRDGLEDRFRLLVHGRRGVAQRQRTLEGVIDWSYERLSGDEQELFAMLSVFPESFELADAVGVSGLDEAHVRDTIDLLVSKSLVLVSRTGTQHATHVTYRLLESLRAYAGERVREAGDHAELQDRHLEWMLRIDGAPEGLLLDQVNVRLATRRFSDMRAAANRALAKGRLREATLLTLGRSVAIVGHGLPEEGLAWLAGRNQLAVSDRLWALNGCAYFALSLGDIEAARRFSLETFELAGDDAYDALPNAYGFAAISQYYTEPGLGAAYIDKAIEIAPRTPSGSKHLAMAHNLRSLILLQSQDWDRAIDDAKNAVAFAPPGSLYNASASVTTLTALLATGNREGFDAALSAVTEANRNSALAWNFQLFRLFERDASSTLVADLASEALNSNGGTRAQRCSDLLAALAFDLASLHHSGRWRAAVPSEISALDLATKSISISPFGALANATARAERGLDASAWFEQQALLAFSCRTPTTRAEVRRLVARIAGD